jgi:hypothetical protein
MGLCLTVIIGIGCGYEPAEVSGGLFGLATGSGLTVSPLTLDFGADAEELPLKLLNASTRAMRYSVYSDSSGFSTDVTGGYVGAEVTEVTVRFDREELASGTHTARLVVAAESEVVAEVVAIGTVSQAMGADGAPALAVSPRELDFCLVTTTAVLTVQNSGGGTLSYSADADVAWAQVSPRTGSSSGEADEILVTVDPTGLAAGEHFGTITVATADGQVAEVAARLLIAALHSDAELLAFGTDSCELELALWPTGGAALEYVITPQDDWVTVSPSAGVAGRGGETVFVSVDRERLPYGNHGSVLHISSPQALARQVVVTLTNVESPWPGFVVMTSDNRIHHYSGAQNYSDALVLADVQLVGDDQWELSLVSRTGTIKQVWFPWHQYRYALNDDDSDDVLYYPYRTGVAQLSNSLSDEWDGLLYPGQTYAPLCAIADKTEARMIAATNWPPRQAMPRYARGRMHILYVGYLQSGVTHKYGAIVATASGDETDGDIPWHSVVDKYKAWLKSNMLAEGLYPLDYPEAMRTVNGFLEVRLETYAQFDVSSLAALYAAVRDDFPWIQCWGQMSNYQRSPGDGRYDWPVPPLEPGEETGCCLVVPAMHPRYIPDLPDFADAVVADGGLIGYYARPSEPYRFLDGSDPEYLAEFLAWLAQNEADGANAFYLDTVGGLRYGDPLIMAEQFYTTFPAMTVIEFPVDLYPVAFLISGSLWGGESWPTMPGQTPDGFGDEYVRATFPRFGRYLMDDRIMFLGGANGDWMFWSQVRGHNCWTERQVFLLGAKFDAPAYINGQPDYYNPVSSAVRQIIDEWNRVGWWAREPVYLDRAGISQLPDQVDVRRFEDKNGVTLLVVDNWFERSNVSFRFDGTEIAVPEQQLRIIEIP